MDNRIFLLENGMILIHDSNGNKASFSSIDSFLAHLPINLPIDLNDFAYICYEPDRIVRRNPIQYMHLFRYQWETVNDTLHKGPVPVPALEQVIANAATLAANAQDVEYTLTPEQKTRLRLARKVMDAAQEYRRLERIAFYNERIQELIDAEELPPGYELDQEAMKWINKHV